MPQSPGAWGAAQAEVVEERVAERLAHRRVRQQAVARRSPAVHPVTVQPPRLGGAQPDHLSPVQPVLDPAVVQRLPDSGEIAAGAGAVRAVDVDDAGVGESGKAECRLGSRDETHGEDAGERPVGRVDVDHHVQRPNRIRDREAHADTGRLAPGLGGREVVVERSAQVGVVLLVAVHHGGHGRRNQPGKQVQQRAELGVQLVSRRDAAGIGRGRARAAGLVVHDGNEHALLRVVGIDHHAVVVEGRDGQRLGRPWNRQGGEVHRADRLLQGRVVRQPAAVGAEREGLPGLHQHPLHQSRGAEAHQRGVEQRVVADQLGPELSGESVRRRGIRRRHQPHGPGGGYHEVRPRTASWMPPKRTAEPCVPVAMAPAMDWPLLAPQTGSDCPNGFS